ncbi:hypothetical protein F5X97DRAFT_288763 [Nemania serpens]|nr:hypothetical protein F5X97DRAFT_288763 [Nemania serpens]
MRKIWVFFFLCLAATVFRHRAIIWRHRGGGESDDGLPMAPLIRRSASRRGVEHAIDANLLTWGCAWDRMAQLRSDCLLSQRARARARARACACACAWREGRDSISTAGGEARLQRRSPNYVV